MLRAAEVADDVRRAGDLGIETSVARVDPAKLAAYRGGVVDRLYRGLLGLLEARGVTIIEGIGRLTSASSIEVGGRQITGRHLIIATGSRPASLPGVAVEGRVITSDQAVRLEWIPRSAIVLGGGVIGVEFASLWRSFGARVTIIEVADRILPQEDEAVSKALGREFRKRGIAVWAGARLESVAQDEAGVRALLDDGRSVEADLLLVAVGRRPNTEAIGLDEAGVRLEDGFVQVDERLHTGAGNVWAVGDIVPGLQLAHRGFAQGVAVAERIAGDVVPPLRESGIPRVTYCEPEVASVGLTEEQAVEVFGAHAIAVETQTLGSNARSVVLGTAGMVKVVSLVDGPVVGIHLVGARVGELVGEAQLIVNGEARADDVARLIHAHPTQGEALGEAFLALAGRPLHALSSTKVPPGAGEARLVGGEFAP